MGLRTFLAVVYIVFCALLFSHAYGDDLQKELDGLFDEIMNPSVNRENYIDLKDAVLNKDKVRIDFDEGSFYPLKAVRELVAGGVFIGKGKLLYRPVEKQEQDELLFFTKSNQLAVDFSMAYFRFNDDSYSVLKNIGTLVDSNGSVPDEVLEVARKSGKELRLAGEMQNKTVTDVLQKNKIYTYNDYYLLNRIYNTGLPYSSFFEAMFLTEEYGWLYVTFNNNWEEEFKIGQFVPFENYIDTWCSGYVAEDYQKKYSDRFERKQYFFTDNHKIDMVHKRTMYDFEATMEMDIIGRADSVLLIKLNLKSTIDVSSVIVNGESQNFGRIRDDEYFYILLNKPLLKDDVFRVQIEYGGHYDLGYFWIFDKLGGWYPNNRDFRHKANYEIKMTLPKTFVAISSIGKPADLKKKWLQTYISVEV